MIVSTNIFMTIAVMIAAAASSPDMPNDPPLKSREGSVEKPGIARDIFARAAPAVVKLYGASLGRQQGYGTGVIVSPDGLIVTNLSVMLASRTIHIVTHDGARYDAVLVRQDDARKLALLKTSSTGLAHLTPHVSGHLQCGDVVYALGNWFKIAEGDESVSFTRGVFSFKTPIDARRLAQSYDYPGPVLVYDAITANPGAAGGPLLDATGSFVGLVGAVVESAATNTRVNHAIPGEDIIAFLRGKSDAASSDSSNIDPDSSTAATHTSDAPTIAHAEPDIGVSLSKLGYRQTWAFVERVRRDSPADRAGIRPDDLIVAVDGRRVTDVAEYQKIAGALVPGQRVPFTVKRGNEIISLDLTVGARP